VFIVFSSILTTDAIRVKFFPLTILSLTISLTFVTCRYKVVDRVKCQESMVGGGEGKLLRVGPMV